MPKNPVRAARQAGRQAVRAAKDTRREKVTAAKTTAKVAKIEARTASKVGKISGTATPKPVAKSTPVAKAAPVSKRNKNAKSTPSTYKPSAPTVKAPSSSTKPKISVTSDMKGTMKDMPTSTRKTPGKKGPSESEKNIVKMWKDKGYTYGKDGKVRDKNGKTPEENEAQRVKDMFLQPGETAQSVSPFASPAKLKEIEKRKKMDEERGFSKNLADFKKRPYGSFKKGGSVKKSMHIKRKK